MRWIFHLTFLCLVATSLRAEESDALTRLTALAQLCEKLAEHGAKADGGDDELHPTEDDVSAFSKLCNWNVDVQYYGHVSLPTTNSWPQEKDAQQLRELLKHSDPAIRTLAIGAIAQLHIPEDVERIGALLNDSTLSGPLPSATMRNVRSTFQLQKSDRLVELLAWRRQPLGTIATEALLRMTGESLDAKNFNAWWPSHRDAQNCLWYWQERLAREKDTLQRMNASTPPAAQEKALTNWRAAWLQTLHALPPELDLKIRLLAVDPHDASAEITHPVETFFIDPIEPRVTKERLLELLAGEHLWPDVDWNDRKHKNRLIERILLSAERFFTPDDLPRLKAIRKNSTDALWWSGGATWYIGPSRLMPPCGANHDDPDTREGWLRKGIREELDVFTRGYILRELINVGLPGEFDFIREQFFKGEKTSAVPCVLESILDGLGTAPLTVEKRNALVELLLDPRSAGGWTRELKFMGDDGFQRRATAAVNAHAGKELIDFQELQALRTPASATQVLRGIFEKIRTLQSSK